MRRVRAGHICVIGLLLIACSGCHLGFGAFYPGSERRTTYTRCGETYQGYSSRTTVVCTDGRRNGDIATSTTVGGGRFGVIVGAKVGPGWTRQPGSGRESGIAMDANLRLTYRLNNAFGLSFGSGFAGTISTASEDEDGASTFWVPVDLQAMLQLAPWFLVQAGGGPLLGRTRLSGPSFSDDAITGWMPGGQVSAGMHFIIPFRSLAFQLGADFRGAFSGSRDVEGVRAGIRDQGVLFTALLGF